RQLACRTCAVGKSAMSRAPRADEGQPLAVLLGSRPLADEHQESVRVAGAEDHLVAPLGEPAAGTDGGLGADFGEADEAIVLDRRSSPDVEVAVADVLEVVE